MLALARKLVPTVRRSPVRALVVAAGVCLLGVAAGALLWPDHLFRWGQRALARREFAQAQRAFEHYLWYRPRSAAAHLLAARAARRGDAPADAERHLTACQELAGVRPDSALEWSLLRAQQGDLGEVEQELRSLSARDGPDTAVILEALVKGYLASERPGDALDTADALLRREPDHPGAHLWRALAAEALHHRAEALPDYRRAVELDPGSDEARLRLADCLAFLGQPREAVAQYEYLLRRRPDDPEALYGLARCRYDAHEPEEAARLLDVLLAREPGNVPALVERGRVAWQGEGPAAAEAWLRRAVAAAPDDLDAHRLLLVYLEAQGKEADVRELTPRFHRLQVERARRDELLAEMQQAPRDPAPRCELGQLLLRSGREEEGVRLLLAALAVDPHHRPSHAALADYYERTGRPDLAGQHRAAP
jgi:tetratricopeptide (TPR) repeat protein